jgi:hypothetical protein
MVERLERHQTAIYLAALAAGHTCGGHSMTVQPVRAQS